MKITQEFTVARPLPVVWEFFHDVGRVAACLPGAEYLGRREDGRHAGRVSAKVGPFQASFEGDAAIDYDDAGHSVRAEGKGVDRKGGSRSRMTMTCNVAEVAGGTRVAVDADVQLSGAIAQFGRTGIITEIANVLIQDFVRNAEAALAEPEPAPAAPAAPSAAGSPAPSPAPAAAPRAAPAASTPISGFSLLAAALKAWLRGLFRKHPG